jgi:hypothetical protein
MELARDLMLEEAKVKDDRQGEEMHRTMDVFRTAYRKEVRTHSTT